MGVGAVVGAAGSIAGGAMSKKGAKKAAKIQAQSAREQMALQKQIYQQNTRNFTPEMNGGNAATQQLLNLLGMGGANAPDPTEIIRNTPGYQFQLGEALGAVNTNAYARGLGNSGATQKALMRTGQNMADGYFNNYFNQVGTVADRGMQAKAAIAGVGTNYANQANTINQRAADAQSNYQLARASINSNMLNGVLQAGGQAFGSSFGSAPNALFQQGSTFNPWGNQSGNGY